MEFKGIDISEHNANINWNQFNNIDFVILRAGYGKSVTQKDKLFEQHYVNAKQRGKHIGIYWYSYAKSTAEAVQEAKCCLEIIKGHEIDYPVYFDIEEQSQRALGVNTCSAMVEAFCQTIEAAGYSAGFYCNVDFFRSVINEHVKQRYTCWIAHWDVTKPAVNAPLWQYTVDRVNNIDLDIAYTDFSEWGKSKVKIPDTNGDYPKIHIKLTIDNKQYEGDLSHINS